MNTPVATVLGVIPARYAASRLPGKPLADLAGKPLVVRVLENAGRAASLDRVLVATDDPRIAEAVRAAGGEARLTSPELPSGSDRAACVVRELAVAGEVYGVVVNIQGDEPFLPPAAVDAAVRLLQGDPGTHLTTLAAPLAPGDGPRPEVVKVVLTGDGRAREFTRASPPPGSVPSRRLFRHLGLYAYRAGYLERFVSLPQSPREIAERLEQLRALEDGAVIRVAVGDWPAFGIDTPEDLERARSRLAG